MLKTLDPLWKTAEGFGGILVLTRCSWVGRERQEGVRKRALIINETRDGSCCARTGPVKREETGRAVLSVQATSTVSDENAVWAGSVGDVANQSQQHSNGWFYPWKRRPSYCDFIAWSLTAFVRKHRRSRSRPGPAALFMWMAAHIVQQVRLVCI